MNQSGMSLYMSISQNHMSLYVYMNMNQNRTNLYMNIGQSRTILHMIIRQSRTIMNTIMNRSRTHMYLTISQNCTNPHMSIRQNRTVMNKIMIPSRTSQSIISTMSHTQLNTPWNTNLSSTPINQSMYKRMNQRLIGLHTKSNHTNHSALMMKYLTKYHILATISVLINILTFPLTEYRRVRRMLLMKMKGMKTLLPRKTKLITIDPTPSIKAFSTNPTPPVKHSSVQTLQFRHHFRITSRTNTPRRPLLVYTRWTPNTLTDLKILISRGILKCRRRVRSLSTVQEPHAADQIVPGQIIIAFFTIQPIDTISISQFFQ